MKALFVIDMQNVCIGKNHAPYFKYDNQKILSAVNKAIENNRDHIVIYIKNVMKKNLINKLAPFQAYSGTPEADLAEGLLLVSDYVFEKYAGDAFTNPELKDFVAQQKIDTIELVGVDGGGCVALTALGGIKNGCQVILNTQAIATMFPEKQNKYFTKLKKEGAIFQ